MVSAGTRTSRPHRERAEEAEGNEEELDKKALQKIAENVSFCATAGPRAIAQRLEELDREWDIERVLMVKASALSLLGVTFGIIRSRVWYLLPAVVSGFMLQHALGGSSPPVEALRRLGFRTRREIDMERFALKALRGDFKDLKAVTEEKKVDADRAMEAVRS